LGLWDTISRGLAKATWNTSANGNASYTCDFSLPPGITNRTSWVLCKNHLEDVGETTETASRSTSEGADSSNEFEEDFVVEKMMAEVRSILIVMDVLLVMHGLVIC